MSAPPVPADRGVRPGALLVLALVSGCGLMWPVLSAGPLALDEHVSYWLIDSGRPGDALTRCLDYAATPPLSSWLELAFLSVFGKSETVFRLPSMLCYLASIVIVFRLGAELGDRWAGGIAALVLAWHPEALDEVRIARCYGLVLLLSATFLWVTIRWLQRAPSWNCALIWGLVAAALMWTHYTAALLVGSVGLSLLFVHAPTSGDRLPKSQVVTAGALLLLLTLPLLPAVERLREWSPFLNYMTGKQPLWATIGPLWWLGLPAGLLLSWGLSAGRGGEQPAVRLPILWLAVWTLVPLLGLSLMARGDLTSLANPRYRVPCAAGGAWLIAALLRSRRARPVTAFAGAAAILVAAWWSSGVAPWQLRRLGDPTDGQWKIVDERIQADARPGEPLLVQSGLVESSLVPVLYDDPLFMDYAACRAGRFYVQSPHPRSALPFLWVETSGITAFYESRLRSMAADGPGSFWVACATDTDLNRMSLDGIQRLAERMGFAPVEVYRQSAVILLHYRYRAD